MKVADRSGPWRLAATCTKGLEEVLENELARLGCEGVERDRGVVRFAGGPRQVVAANLWLRTAMRVMLTLTRGAAGSREELYALVSEIAWEDIFADGQTFVVDVAGRGDAFANTTFAALVVKDAVVDRLRTRRGSRPDVDKANPDLRLHLHLAGRHADLALDSTGEPLSHRGWRPRSGPAPLAESLASGVLLLAGYDGSQPLLDPMCGTGTIAVEAALIATGSAPGAHRGFAFERWGFLPPTELAQARRHAHERRHAAAAPIVASDVDARAAAAARRNAHAASVAEAVRCETRDVRSLDSLAPGSMVVSNPPYGHRLGDAAGLVGLYRSLGDVLKRRAAGSTAWLLVGNPDLAREIGLRPSRRIVLFNGPIECRLLRFDLYEGGGSGQPAPGRERSTVR